MKKRLVFLFACSLCLGMMMSSCEKPDPEDPGNPGTDIENPDQPDVPSNPSTIRYTNLEDNPIVVNDGDEMTFFNLLPGAGLFGFQCGYEGWFTTEAGTSFLTDEVGWAKPLEEGFPINNDSRWFTNPQGPMLYYCIWAPEYEAWAGKTAYLGVCVKTGEDYHYGWIKIQVNTEPDLQFKILGYAYESQPNTYLSAGQK